MPKEAPEYTVTKYRVEGSSYSSGRSDHEPEYRRLYRHLSKRSREIRLLRLEPSSDAQAKIRCSLIRTTVDSGIKFEALSYTWGDPGQEKWIIVDGLEVPVRKKLWEALIHLRYRDQRRTLWIDALCIDQINVFEKNHQVKKMSQIYLAATRVVVWLGVEGEDSTRTLRFIAFVGQYREKYGRDPDIVNDYDIGSILEGFRRLCQRMYWKRLWIVQEVVLARKVWIQCGMERISWDDLDSFLFLFAPTTYQTTQPTLRKVLPTGGVLDIWALSNFHESALNRASLHTMTLVVERMRQSRGLRSPLEGLVRLFSGSVCFDTKDAIYGVFGLSCDATDLTVDYSKSNFEIFSEVIKLQRYNRISHARSSLIEFSRNLQRSTFHGHIRVSEKAHVERVSTSTVGFLIGVIRYMGPLHRHASSFVATSQDQDIERLLHFADGYGETSVKLLASTLDSSRLIDDVSSIHSEISYGVDGGVDMFDPEFTLSSGFSVDECKNMRKECILAGDSWGRPAQLPERARPMKPLSPQQLLEYEGAEPQFFVDDEGRVGLAPSNSREGDIICRFRYSDILAILRWQRDRYVFVGRAKWPRKDGPSDSVADVLANELGSVKLGIGGSLHPSDEQFKRQGTLGGVMKRTSNWILSGV
ncbi:uncharacterized protein PAC_19220 [Phialocephala subalpina]|uniref:Heterokaryon incompatibility domain-containing protein n=1 Tax=Phialocephala subalpina TaxID=576137 RepID=A0A1L7XWE9_9HELO|nr:uncharacterized protein PAC_19220 [Phialocephala subalpina]